MPKLHKSYWQLYDSLYKKSSKKQLFKRLLEQVELLGNPIVKIETRGRKPKFTPLEYIAFICFEKIFGNKYREMELDADLFLPEKADHSTFQRWYEKIPLEYLQRLTTSFVNREFTIWIADSTAMSSKINVERLTAGTRNKTKLTDKYHIIIGYDPPTHTTMIIGVVASDHTMSDSQGAMKILEQVQQAFAWFLGDSAYHTYALHQRAKEIGLYAQLKPDKKGIKRKLSAKAKQTKLFCSNIYKQIRGVVETVFGGSTNAGLMLSYAKKEHTRRLDTLILAVRHNFFAAMRNALAIILRQTLVDGNLYKWFSISLF